MRYRRITSRPVLRVLLACAAAAVAAPPAAATTIEYSDDGLTFVIKGVDSASHEFQFRFAGDDTNNPYDEFIDPVGFTSIPADCTVVTEFTRIKCPAHAYVELHLGGGNDAVYFDGANFDCYEGYVLDLGEGDNRLDLSDQCGGGGTATVTSGAGDDTLTGGAQAAITFLSGGGRDSVYGGTGNDVLHGGPGDDRLLGLAGNDQLFGEDGSDTPGGGPGDDLIDGGPGDDALDKTEGAISGNEPGAGADTYVGGAGTDKLWLDGHVLGMSISIDGQANDGAAGEGDNVGSDIESILGTVVDDVFTGSPGTDTFDGNGGNDEIRGAGGDDFLNGGSGDDRLFGDAGADKVEGSNGSDRIEGGAGEDGLYGDTAACSVFCAFDADTVFARDGERDVVDCGGGADQAQVDEADVVAYCSTVDRPVPAPSPSPSPQPASVATLAPNGRARIRTGVPLAVTCPASCRFSVTLSLDARTARRFRVGRRIGIVRGSLLQAGRKAARLRLTAEARRRLRRASSVRASLRLKATDAGGKVTTASRKVTLRR